MSSRMILCVLLLLLSVPIFCAVVAADDIAAIGPQPKGTVITEALTNSCFAGLSSNNLLDANVHCFRISVLWYDYSSAHSFNGGSESPFRGWALESTQPISDPPTRTYGWYYYYVDDNSIVDRGNSIILDPSQVTVSSNGRSVTAHVLGADLTWQSTTGGDLDDSVEDIKITRTISEVAQKWSVRYVEHQAALSGRLFVISDSSRWVEFPGVHNGFGTILRRWEY
jgi:hypothetical protein